MIRAVKIIFPPDPQLENAHDTITLSREDRYRRRKVLRSDNELAFLLDLPEATYLPHGSAVELEDGRLITIRAASEELLKITAPDALALMRIAWHIGNRHTSAEITPEAIFIQSDHVLADMVRGLGGYVTEVSRSFEPEGGAYGGYRTLTKNHHHGHSH